MDIDFIRRFVCYGLATLIVFLPLLIGRGSDEADEEQNLADTLYQGVSFARTDNLNMPAIMLHPSGDSIVALSDDEGRRISGAIFRDKDGQSLTV